MVKRLLLLTALFLAPICAHAQSAIVAAGESVGAACGGCIAGLAMPSPSDQSTWTINFLPSATATQQSEAWAALKSKTGTPALDGTYAIDPAARATIDGIYAGIKDGDGLPGAGTTFNFSDVSGAQHAFDATSFPNFAKAVRDYLYALSQGQSPAQPVAIP